MPTRRETLSVGDALTIFALLAFAFGWPIMVDALSGSEGADPEGSAAWGVLLLFLGPTVFCLYLVHKLIVREDP